MAKQKQIKKEEKTFRSIDEVKKHYFPKAYAEEQKQKDKKKEMPIYACRSLLRHGAVIIG